MVSALCAAALLGLTITGTFSPWPVFAISAGFRHLNGPSCRRPCNRWRPIWCQSRDLANSIAWNSSSWQTAAIVGPVAGGLLYGIGPVVAYSVALAFMLIGAFLVFFIEKPAQTHRR